MIDDTEDQKINFVFVGGWRLTATVDEHENFKVKVSNEQGEPIVTNEGNNEWYFDLVVDEKKEE